MLREDRAHDRELAARYRAEEHGQVWDELAQLGSALRERDALEEAQFVCDEMARRARHTSR